MSNTTGGNNTATGQRTLFSNETGDFNTATGRFALASNTAGSFNTATGADALNLNITGFNNTATGVGALAVNTTGGSNTATGENALYFNTTGGNNIALGFRAGRNLTTGDNNIDIGNEGVAGESNAIRIGTQGTQTVTYIAGVSGARVMGSAVKVNAAGQIGTAPSSARFKQNIRSMGDTSDALFALRPVTFCYKQEIDPEGIQQFGLVAEEVEKVDPNLVIRDADGKPYTVRYEAVDAMLLNEFLKQHRKVEELKSTMAKQEATISQLKSTVAKQEATAKHQQEQIGALGAAIEKVSARVEMSNPAPKMVLNDE